MPNAVGGPVLWYAHANQVVERVGASPHVIGAGVIIRRLTHGFGRHFHQAHQQGFRLPVLHNRSNRVSQILFKHMHKGVHKAVADLFFGE